MGVGGKQAVCLGLEIAQDVKQAIGRQGITVLCQLLEGVAQ